MVVQMGRYDGGRLAAFVRTHIYSLIPFERTTEQTAETITFSSNTTTAVKLANKRITSLGKMLLFCMRWSCTVRKKNSLGEETKQNKTVPTTRIKLLSCWLRSCNYPNKLQMVLLKFRFESPCVFFVNFDSQHPNLFRTRMVEAKTNVQQWESKYTLINILSLPPTPLRPSPLTSS